MHWVKLTHMSELLIEKKLDVYKIGLSKKLRCSIKGLSFGSKDYTKELKTVECKVFWVRLASFGELGLISDPKISSKLQNGINDPKGLD